MAGSARTQCPDCGIAVLREPRAKMHRDKRCGDCTAVRSRESKQKYRQANREQTRIASRIPGVVGRDLACQQCGLAFLRAGGRGPDPKWCPECRASQSAGITANYRARYPEKTRDQAKVGGARRRGAARISVEAIERAVVFERDGWLCGLCGGSVDKRLPWPDPMSPSLDHIVPLSLGGHHLYANVQLAHLRCNLVKGNRVGVAS